MPRPNRHHPVSCRPTRRAASVGAAGSRPLGCPARWPSRTPATPSTVIWLAWALESMLTDREPNRRRRRRTSDGRRAHRDRAARRRDPHPPGSRRSSRRDDLWAAETDPGLLLGLLELDDAQQPASTIAATRPSSTGSADRRQRSRVRLRRAGRARDAAPIRSTTGDEGLAVNPNKALWEKGDFTRIAASMRESGEALVADLGITTGSKVLDLGCGDGTTALPAARSGRRRPRRRHRDQSCRGRERARRQRVSTNCRFQEGDATDLRNLRTTASTSSSASSARCSHPSRSTWPRRWCA